MSRWQTKKGISTLRFHILWNLDENILKFSRNLSCEIILYISTMICQNRNVFLYCLNAIKYTEHLRKVTGSVVYTVKTGTPYHFKFSTTVHCSTVLKFELITS
jgi:hypothetical protein